MRIRILTWLISLMLFPYTVSAEGIFAEVGSGTFLGEAQIAAGYGFRNGLILSNGIGRTRALDGINIY